MWNITLLYLHPIKKSFTLTIQSGKNIGYKYFKNGIIKNRFKIDTYPILINIYDINNILIYTGKILNSKEKFINMYRPKNKIHINNFTIKNISNENIICCINHEKYTCVKLYITYISEYPFIKNKIIKINEDFGLRYNIPFYKDSSFRKFVKILQTDFSHSNLQSPSTGLIKIIENSNKNKDTIIKIVSRDGIIRNPLNGIIIDIKYINGYTIIFFEDENYISPFNNPRFMNNHEQNNQLCLNREILDFHQKRNEPKLKYVLMFKSSNLDKIYKNFYNGLKGTNKFKVIHSTNVYLILKKNIITNIKKINKHDIFMFPNEIIGVV